MDGTDAGSQWTERMAITGHQDVVRGLSWSPGGDYLISTGCVNLFAIQSRASPFSAGKTKLPVSMHPYHLPSGTKSIAHRSTATTL
jgi:WD40 repeat protein